MILSLFLFSCGKSYEEQKRLSRAEKARLAKEDSLALKVGTLPTLDCLPLFVAYDHHFFEKFGEDVRIKPYQSQIDCDDAMLKGKIEGNVTDVVRAQRMRHRGTALRYVAATNAYWQLFGNRLSRIHEVKQLQDKMVGMARYSVTDMLTSMAVDSAKLKSEYVFRIQINDPVIRLRMLVNNELDAMFFTEPQATAARIQKHPVLMDSRKKDLWMGAIVFKEKAIADKRRQKQLTAFIKAYNEACDSINQRGMAFYGDIIKKYTKADDRTVRALPVLKFEHAMAPRQKDLDRADQWLK
jgi:NitT/TauT family transport system substrate-binding protein